MLCMCVYVCIYRYMCVHVCVYACVCNKTRNSAQHNTSS